MTGSGYTAFTRNFNPFTSSTINGGFVKGAVYEPLIVATAAGGGHVYPWLAQSWKWTNNNKTLNLTIRKGVRWSDGQPLNAADVAYSLSAGKQDKVMDIIGVTRKGMNIKSIRQTSRDTVAINLRAVDSQFIASNLTLQFVAPKHIWSKVADPSTFRNPNPVGSGPFTQFGRFTTQDFVLNKNPTYWKKGAPKIPCLEYLGAASNDAALLLIQSGKVDWTHNFVQNVESTYEAKDKAHFHSFYATTSYPISLTFDTSQYPYSLVAFRQALSMAIDRNTVSKLGEYGYAPPADGVGLNGIFPQWVTDPSVKAEAKRLATYNPNGAKKLLQDSGFTYKGDKHRPEGQSRVVRHPRHLGLVGLGRVAEHHHEEPAVDRSRRERQARARLQHLVPARRLHQGHDASVPGRRHGLAVRLLLREHAPERVRPAGTGRHVDRQLGALSERASDDAPRPVESLAEARCAAPHLDAAAVPVAQGVPDHPALHRAALVDVQHEVLPLLHVA